jgi:hypothetical protein
MFSVTITFQIFQQIWKTHEYLNVYMLVISAEKFENVSFVERLQETLFIYLGFRIF